MQAYVALIRSPVLVDLLCPDFSSELETFDLVSDLVPSTVVVVVDTAMVVAVVKKIFVVFAGVFVEAVAGALAVDFAVTAAYNLGYNFLLYNLTLATVPLSLVPDLELAAVDALASMTHQAANIVQCVHISLHQLHQR